MIFIKDSGDQFDKQIIVREMGANVHGVRANRLEFTHDDTVALAESHLTDRELGHYFRILLGCLH